MIKVTKYADILNLRKNYSPALVDMLLDDLFLCYKENEDNYQEAFSDFDAEDAGNGYIALLFGCEDTDEFDELGLTNGYSDIIPEGRIQEYIIDGSKWSRVVVNYTNTCSMIFWCKDTTAFDTYIHGDVEAQIAVPF